MRIWNLTKPVIEMNIKADITDSESAEKTISQFFNHCTAPWEFAHIFFSASRVAAPATSDNPSCFCGKGRKVGRERLGEGSEGRAI